MLAAADSAGERLAINTLRLESAAAALATAGTTYSAEVAQLTEATKKALADYIERRASTTTSQALAEHRKAMQEAATLAFADQLAPAVRDIARQIEMYSAAIGNRLAPLVGSFVVGAVLGIGGAALWLR